MWLSATFVVRHHELEIIQLLEFFQLVCELFVFIEELDIVLIFVNLLKLVVIDLPLRMSLTLDHQRSLILNPVVEQVENKRPDGFESEVFKMSCNAVGDFDQF